MKALFRNVVPIYRVSRRCRASGKPCPGKPCERYPLAKIPVIPRYVDECTPRSLQGLQDIDRIPSSYQQPKIVIIGAGMAGLSAADRLLRCGFTDVVVVDALDRPGGRIQSCQMGDGYIDTGPGWLLGCVGPVYGLACVAQLVKKACKPTLSPDLIVSSTRCGPALDAYKIERAMRLACDLINKAVNIYKHQKFYEGSLWEFIHDKFISQKDNLKLLRFECEPICLLVLTFIREIQNAWGIELDKLNAGYFGSSVELPGKMFIRGGMDQILQPLLKTVGNRILLRTRVVKVLYKEMALSVEPSRAKVICKGGPVLNADYVICTLPLGVLKNEHLCIFSPHLPKKKAEAIHHLGFGFKTNVFLEWQKPWWFPNELFLRPLLTEHQFLDYCDWTRGVIMIDQAPGNTSVLKIEFGGNAALEVEKMRECSVIEGLTCLIRDMTKNVTIPYPISMARSKWNYMDYFLGTNTYLGMSSKISHLSTLGTPEPGIHTPPAPIILFAGEHTIPGHFATMCGARLSGLREADRILQYTHQFRGPPPLPGGLNLKCL